MLIGRDSTGKAQEIRTNENGNLEVVVSGGSGTSSETTLNASVQTVGTTATTINVNKKVTSIDVANYSESADVTVGVGTSNYVIGSSVATTLAINKDVTTISLTSTEADTKVQIVIKVAEESQGGGGDDSGDDEESLTPITENMDFNNVAMPSNMKVQLSKNILDYLTAEEKAEIEQQLENDGYASHYLYQYVDIPHVDEEEESPENSITDMNLYLSINEDGIYQIYFEGYTHREEHNDSNEFHVTFSSLDGVNFFVSSFSVLYYDYDIGTEYSIIPPKIELPITINFSEIINGSEEANGWNNVLSEFLFTDNN